MNRERFLIPILSGMAFAFAFSAAASDVAISEVLFNAVGSDTGQEYVVIKNFGNSDVSLSGWDLYSDTAGYFNFSIALAAGSTVKIHLRASGTDDAENIYFSSASGNMGNSSGSVALFSSTIHSKDTIISFMRYQKPGSAESKTWESVASGAGIWTAGAFVDITNLSEGQELYLNNFSKRFSASGWQIVSPTANGSTSTNTNNTSDTSNIASSTGQTTTSGQAISPDSSNSGWVEDSSPKLKFTASAGADRTVLAGAVAGFEASADGLDADSFSKSRFLWNFGDGFTAESPKVAHAFIYPGIYTVFLNIVSSNVSVSDAAKITAVANPVVISELKPDGWIELQNNSPRNIDFSNLGLQIGGEKPFYFPSNTFLSPYAFLVLGKEILGTNIPASGEIKLLYPNGDALFSLSYSAVNLTDAESLSLFENQLVRSKATPGTKNELIKTPNGSAPAAKSQVQGKGKDKSLQNDIINIAAEGDRQTASPSFADGLSSFVSQYFWLFVGLGAGILAGSAFILIKR